MSSVVLSVAWFTRENFVAHKCLDPAGLPSTFDEWLRDAEAATEELARMGRSTARIVIDPREFAAWCAAEGQKTDGAARAAFVAHLSKRMSRSRFKATLRAASSTVPVRGGADGE